MKTGLNNVLLLPKLFNVVNNIVQHCYTRFRLNSINCSILLTTMNNVGSTTLSNQHVDNFLLCRSFICLQHELYSSWYIIIYKKNCFKSILLSLTSSPILTPLDAREFYLKNNIPSACAIWVCVVLRMLQFTCIDCFQS